MTAGSGSSAPSPVPPAEGVPAAVTPLARCGEPVCLVDENGPASAAPRPTSMLQSKKSIACLPPPPPSLATAAPGLCALRPSLSPIGPLLPPSLLLPVAPRPLLLSLPLPSTLRLRRSVPSASAPAARGTPSPSAASPSMAEPIVVVVVDPPVARAPPPYRLACIGKGVMGGKG